MAFSIARIVDSSTIGDDVPKLMYAWVHLQTSLKLTHEYLIHVPGSMRSGLNCLRFLVSQLFHPRRSQSPSEASVNVSKFLHHPCGGHDG